MTEPTGRTIDGAPWEEPRPPHLPDRLTAISPWVLPFLIVVAYQVWLLWVGQPLGIDETARLDYWVNVARSEFPAIAATLLGLALFIRHPDARSTLPHMASGVFLLLFAQILRLAKPAIGPLVDPFATSADDFEFYFSVAQAYGVLTTLIGVAGIAFVARGLGTARRHGEAVPARSVSVVVTVLVMVSSALTAFSWVRSGVDTSPGTIAAIAVSWLVGLVAALAWAYLFVVSLVGWRGGETPRLGWALAAMGAGLALLVDLLLPVIVILVTPQEQLLRMFEAVGAASLIAWVLLVVALAVGLPSTDPRADDLGPEPTPDPPGATQPGSAAG
jgi:hypothetical protein